MGKVAIEDELDKSQPALALRARIGFKDCFTGAIQRQWLWPTLVQQRLDRWH
jgi:hypothetical protein